MKANSGVRARVPAPGKVLEGDDQPSLLREDVHYLHYITIIPGLPNNIKAKWKSSKPKSPKKAKKVPNEEFQGQQRSKNAKFDLVGLA